jgi:hypothetical protein
MPSLKQTRPQMPAMPNARPITGDGDGSANSTRAAGADLLNRSLLDTSKLNGKGGRLDLLG